MSQKIPSALKFGSVSFPLFQTSDDRIGFRYKTDDGWKQVIRRDLAKLRSDAERIALGIINAETAAIEMTAEERRIYIAARDLLSPMGISVDEAARQLSSYLQAAGGISISEIIRFYHSHRPEDRVIAPPTAKILEELLFILRDGRKSAIYIRGIKRDGEKFAEAFPDLTRAEALQMRIWLSSRTKRNGDPVSGRRRDNFREMMVRLFSFAQDRHYLPQNKKTEAEKIERLDIGTEVQTYTPSEMSLLLEHVSNQWLPWLALGAFAGMRTSEIFRLDWSSVKWDQRVIAVSRTIAKKVRISRQVPIGDNLFEWLKPWRDSHGPIYDSRDWQKLESAHSDELARLRSKTGLQTLVNGNRHSYGSHRLAIVKSIDQVAHEMGTSSAKIRTNYNDPKPETEGHLYFSIQPPDSMQNILPLPLVFA